MKSFYASALLLIRSIAAHPTIDARNVPIGIEIRRCEVPGTIALTYDDGPSIYTSQLLDMLDEAGAKATFFINGSGKPVRGDINLPGTQWAALINRMHAEGHQVASHTWTHADLSTLSYDGMTAELVNNEEAFFEILGFTPSYFRAPFLSCNDVCMGLIAGFGYKMIGTDLDPKDYEHQSPDTIVTAMNNFDRLLNEGGSITLAHDIHQQTVVALTPHMLRTVQARGLRMVTVGECLGDNQANWYRARGPRQT